MTASMCFPGAPMTVSKGYSPSPGQVWSFSPEETNRQEDASDKRRVQPIFRRRFSIGHRARLRIQRLLKDAKQECCKQVSDDDADKAQSDLPRVETIVYSQDVRIAVKEAENHCICICGIKRQREDNDLCEQHFDRSKETSPDMVSDPGSEMHC